MNNDELYEAISNTHDVRVMFDNEIRSKADFEREHNEIRKTWEL